MVLFLSSINLQIKYKTNLVSTPRLLCFVVNFQSIFTTKDGVNLFLISKGKEVELILSKLNKGTGNWYISAVPEKKHYSDVIGIGSFWNPAQLEQNSKHIISLHKVKEHVQLKKLEHLKESAQQNRFELGMTVIFVIPFRALPDNFTRRRKINGQEMPCTHNCVSYAMSYPRQRNLWAISPYLFSSVNDPVQFCWPGTMPTKNHFAVSLARKQKLKKSGLYGGLCSFVPFQRSPLLP